MTDSPLPLGDPFHLGFDPERLARIGPAMQAFVEDRRVPNLVTLVARRGRLYTSTPAASWTWTKMPRLAWTRCSACGPTPSPSPAQRR